MGTKMTSEGLVNDGAPAVETKTYEIVFTDGKRQRITIPATWKVSFGAIVPSSAKSAAIGHSSGGWGLRVWEATDKQRAVYANVESFHDVSIPVTVQAVRYFGTKEWLADDGSYVGTKLVPNGVERAWVGEDQIVATPEPDEETEVGEGPYAMSYARKRRS